MTREWCRLNVHHGSPVECARHSWSLQLEMTQMALLRRRRSTVRGTDWLPQARARPRPLALFSPCRLLPILQCMLGIYAAMYRWLPTFLCLSRSWVEAAEVTRVCTKKTWNKGRCQCSAEDMNRCAYGAVPRVTNMVGVFWWCGIGVQDLSRPLMKKAIEQGGRTYQEICIVVINKTIILLWVAESWFSVEYPIKSAFWCICFERGKNFNEKTAKERWAVGRLKKLGLTHDSPLTFLRCKSICPRVVILQQRAVLPG